MKQFFESLIFLLLCAIIFAFSIRGIPGNPTSFVINDPIWKDEGPFELSPERGRFALVLSMIENGSLEFTLPVAQFATPDLGYKDGRYVSLFAPGVSFLVTPGYAIGTLFGLGQVGTFAVITCFALLNALLIRAIARRLGAHPMAASIGALIFLFATPAFPYAVSLYQHHISTFLILSSISVLLKWKSAWSLLLIWFLIAASIPVDYPNLFLMIPIGLFALSRILFIKRSESSYGVTMRLGGILTFVTVILPLTFFLWFNNVSYGNPFQLSGTVPSVKAIDAQTGLPAAPKTEEAQNLDFYRNPEKQEKSAVGFFRSRNLLNGFFIHFLSPDRGIVWFTPVILLSIFGAVILYKTNPSALSLLVSVIGVNVLLYSLWGDPWGGWAFGSRYFIPSYALLSILTSLFLTRWRSDVAVLSVVFLYLSYSVAINTAGALTSSRNPPQVEVLSLEKLSGIEQKYTVERNFDMLWANRSKSYIFQTTASKSMTAWNYYLIVTGVIIIISWIYVFRLGRSD